jgi:hypothetical protein
LNATIFVRFQLHYIATSQRVKRPAVAALSVAPSEASQKQIQLYQTNRIQIFQSVGATIPLTEGYIKKYAAINPVRFAETHVFSASPFWHGVGRWLRGTAIYERFYEGVLPLHGTIPTITPYKSISKYDTRCGHRVACRRQAILYETIRLSSNRVYS